MSLIKILDPFTANQIAAGEVVERPASVVKELCENALDAGASVISISIQNGGIVAISVNDNGTGMDREDAKVAFLRHSTSKLNTIQDFDSIKTMGFRGEALASIASVSKITLRTKQIGSPEGSIVKIEGGEILEHGSTGCPEGTSILVEYLFYNTPARYKFLKKDATEASYIMDFVERFILARPDVSFRLIQNNQETLHSPGNNDLRSAIFSVYGKAITQALIPISYQAERIRIDGFIGKPEIARNTRQDQSIFVNSRYIKSKTISAAVEEGYRTLLMKGRFAFCVLNIHIAPALVDVNVHPQKTEVKFWNDQEVFLSVVHAIKEALSTGITIQEITPRENKKSSDTPVLFQYPIPEDNPDSAHAFRLKEENPIPFQEETNPNPAADSIPSQEFKECNVPMDTKINELSAARFIGILFHTYLILELDGSLLLIDQHAAHERILFEKLIEKHRNRSAIAQPLLTPVIMEFPVHEVSFITDNMTLLSRIGFEVEVFGMQSVILRSVPLDLKETDLQDAFHAVLDSIENSIQTQDEQIANAFYSIACKAAVKANDRLDDIEVTHLLEELQKIPNPTHCPHGRPVLLKMSQYEIEKNFKRIVT